jgi:hypothetical protein
LSGANEEQSCLLYVAQFVVVFLFYGFRQFLPREGRQSDFLQKLVSVLAQDLKKVHDISVDVVVRLDRGGLSIKEDGGGPTERFDVLYGFRELGENKIQMAVFASVPTKWQHLAHLYNYVAGDAVKALS